MNRLQTLSREVAAQLSLAPPEARRRAAITACALAIETSGLDAMASMIAWDRIRARRPLTTTEKQQLQELLGQLDDDYLKAHEDSENGSEWNEGCLSLFMKARTVAALLYAAEEGEQDLTSECIYEAAIAGDQERVLAAVRLSIQEPD